ncbi:GH36-type glycosyl hydrolase domain-containing protein [Ideonella sp. BN130291]|uniref:GH36-type glycosyl hydrolase domain-containing protein n=1 Tax=Ideonella sp. BN130291 TaxID=3112940 RepID=UPI002E26EE81|nr:glucoamylase family protein [Ideonella sp. BN130291]
MARPQTGESASALSPSRTPVFAPAARGLAALRSEARAFLTSAGAVPQPVRAALFGREGFHQHGISLAMGQPVERRRGRRRPRTPPFFPRLLDNLQALARARAYLERVDREGDALSPAAEWLLDNFHLIEAQAPEIRSALPAHYYAHLPKLRGEPLAGLPRIYGIAWAFVAHTDSNFDPQLLAHFLQAYQAVDTLTLGELWALPTTLRVVLMENLARLAETVASNKAAREAATWCCDHPDRTTEAELDALFARAQRRGVQLAFLAQMSQRVHGPNPGDAAQWQGWLAAHVPDATAHLAAAQAEQAANNVSVSHAVNALRSMANFDWGALVNAVSPVLQRLRTAPSFRESSELTRDQCTHAIERLAQQAGVAELEVAERALALAEESDATRRLGPAHYLIGAGRAQLAAALGQAPSRPWHSPRWRWAVYSGALVLGTIGLVNAALAGQALVPWAELLSVILLAVPASECAVALVHRLAAETMPVQRLPRLALEGGLQEEHRTLVVIPCMLDNSEAIARQAQWLEECFLANPERHCQFALLSDWLDAPQRQAANDALLLDAARAAVQALNLRHGGQAVVGEGEEGTAGEHAPARFLLLHRERSWSDSEAAWIGWERKRGKLEQLVSHLAGAAPSPFIDLQAESRIAPGTQFVVTLDSDTQLPPGSLRELVAVAAHPLNQPQLAPHSGRVVGGHAVLQPRIAAPIPPRETVTPFGWLHCGGHWGLDAYGNGSSEVYQDLFGEGSFAGKGLIHVRAFHAALRERIPEGRLLSHDLYEGIWARCAHLSDVALFERQPMHPDADAARRHRWTRGDWQLLPFLRAALHGGVGAVNLWKMVDNLRRSLMAPMSVALLWWSFTLEGVAPGRAVLLVFAAYAAGPLLGALASLVPRQRGVALAHLLREGGRDVARALLGGVWQLAALMDQALLRADAIGRAVWRMAVSRRHLLQWTTAAQAESGAPAELPTLLRRHAPACVAAVAWTVLGLLQHDAHVGWLLGFGLLWLLSPLAFWLMGQPLVRLAPGRPLPGADRQYLQELARDTWRLFERSVSADHHHLPPAHLQLEPRSMLAHQTSPTHIGLYLLATVSAHRLGFIGTDELTERLQQTLGTLERLPRHRGHFHQAIDTQSLRTLAPPYVSTVDSGNLAAHLWAVAQACREFASGPAPHDAMQQALRTAVLRLRHASDATLRSWLQEAPLQALLQEDLWVAWRRDPARLRRLLDAAQAVWAERTAQATQERPELQPLADLLRQLDSLLRDREVDRDQWAGALRALAERADMIAGAIDFSFLYDPQRRLFHVGYRPADAALETTYHDLLASDSRLASYVAIAKGDVPRRHWSVLARPFIGVRARPTLRSWSGSMFEYLMPSLVLDEPCGGLLQRALAAAVQEQRDFGQARGLPWGVSESAYFAQDTTLAFQQARFGVPRLALRRTPVGDKVVAPHASVLAAMVDTAAAVSNLKRLERLGTRGLCGFVDAIDFTASRRGDEGQPQVVPTFLAHHQGMSLAALCNVLHGNAVRGWFMRAPLAQSHAALLQERLPREIVFQAGQVRQRAAQPAQAPAQSSARVIDPSLAPLDGVPTQLLGNGSYSVTLRPGGAGASCWRGHAVSRSRDDALRDAHGHWLMLRRADDVEFHSLSRAPNPRPDALYTTRFFNDRVEFDAECDDWESKVTVWVSADDDVEFRRVMLHNLADTDTEFELLSWFEVVLGSQGAEAAHPAFAGLFVQAHAAGEHGVLLERRPRAAGETPVWGAHFLATCDVPPAALRITCDRARLLPRLGQVSQARPGPSQQPRADGQLDTGLDPVASLAVRLVVPAQARVSLTFATAAGDDAASLRALMDKYSQDAHLQRARRMSATLTRIRHRELDIAPDDLHAIQDLTSLMLHTPSRPRPAPAQALDKRVLSRFGISGDKPIMMVRVNAAQGVPLVHTLLAAQRLWAGAGLACDLVVVNGEPAATLAPLQEHISALHQALGSSTREQTDPGGVHVLRLQEIDAAEIAALQAYARIDLLADGRPLNRLLAQVLAQHRPASRAVAAAAQGDDARPLPDRRQRAAIAEAPWAHEPAPSQFLAQGAEFEIRLDSQRVTPRPWANVLANPDFGCLLTESGGGFTWARNSRMNQLTGWSNDALLDPASEHFLLQDAGTRETWGLLPTLERNGLQGYRVTHTQGESRFSHERGALAVDVRVAVHPQASAKVLQLQLRNTGDQPRMLRLVGMVEWVLGAQRADRWTVATEFVPELQAVLARQLEHQGGFGGGTAFLMLCGPRATQWTCAREEFFDALGRLRVPRALGGAAGLGLDPCGALDATLVLPAGGEVNCSWVLGWGDTREAALDLAERLQVDGAAAAVPDAAAAAWQQRLGTVSVRTPDPLFDALVNHWLPYQATACRLWGRSGFYQAGGAIGFRDQLQDAMGLAHAAPQQLRDQLLLHASRQFPEGDVQHWWHPPTGAGVRTRMSDDLLWLPLAIQHYLQLTGDEAVLETPLPFIEGQPVPDGQDELYATPSVSRRSATLYEHAALAIDRALKFGAHGLPLMGSGDWNDGMNRVGHQGRGESVWLGWFLLVLLRDWLPRAQARADEPRARRWAEARQALQAAMQQHGWDGRWYRRAYFDNGHPLGSHLNAECQIDLIAQAWAVFASPPGDARAREAMASADSRLVDRRTGVIQLLHPPLQWQADDAGYIQAYPPGVRENGGQYSHAAVWALMAQAELGNAELAWEYFTLLSPAHRSRGAAAQRRYRLEPYVMPGDVYSQAPYEGRGGWSWYTGSAAWLYRAALESLLGLVLRADKLCFSPCLPPHWPEAELTLRLYEGHPLRVLLRAPGAAQELPANARRVAVGEWVAPHTLAPDTLLVVDVPSPRRPPQAHSSEPAAAEA